MKRSALSQYNRLSWEQRKLGDVLSITTRTNSDNEYGKEDVLSVSDEFGLVNQIEFQGRSFSADDVSGYKKVIPGDIVYTRSPLAAKPYGIIKKSFEKSGIISPLYIVNTAKPGNDSTFVYYNFDSPAKTNNYLKPLVRMGAKHTMNISNDEWLSGEISVPSEKEQRQIGALFKQLDDAITLHQRKLWREAIVVYFLAKIGVFAERVVSWIKNHHHFVSSWEQRKLGGLVQFSKGTGYSKGDLKESGIPIILYGRLYTKYETVIADVDTFADEKPGSVYSRGGEVIVPASGETAEDISIASVVEKSRVLLGGDLNIITPPEALDSAFLAISISNGKPHNDMAKMAQGKSVVHLHNSDLEKIDLAYPSHEEQVKISDFFRGIDNLITLHQRKLENVQKLKKSMLQKMFPKNGEAVPEVRFPGFTDDWEQRKFSDFTFAAGLKNKENLELEPFAITNDKGFVPQSEAHEEFGYMSDVDRTMYIIVKPNSFAYNPARINVGSLGYYKGLENVIVSSLYEVFQTSDDVDDNFLNHWFKTCEFQNWIERLQEGSVRLYFYYDKLCECRMMMPSIHEQKKIGTFLDQIDDIITLHQRKLEMLKALKKGLLQQMFCN